MNNHNFWFDYMINSQKIENDECCQIQTQVEN